MPKPVEEEEDNRLNIAEQTRIECRAFARVFGSKDGQMVLECLKRDMGWDFPGPASIEIELKNGRQESTVRDEWMGGRKVIFMIIDRISKGRRLLSEPTPNQKTHTP
jgi:hypothetical protein